VASTLGPSKCGFRTVLAVGAIASPLAVAGC
jgi:hypothetical protein